MPFHHYICILMNPYDEHSSHVIQIPHELHISKLILHHGFSLAGDIFGGGHKRKVRQFIVAVKE